MFNKREILKDELERNCLLYEIKMMREMNHDRIMQVYEIYEGENYIYCLSNLF